MCDPYRIPSREHGHKAECKEDPQEEQVDSQARAEEIREAMEASEEHKHEHARASNSRREPDPRKRVIKIKSEMEARPLLYCCEGQDWLAEACCRSS